MNTADLQLQQSQLNDEQRVALLERFARMEGLLDAGAVANYDDVLCQLDIAIACMLRLLDPLVPWMEIEVGGVAASDYMAQLEGTGVRVSLDTDYTLRGWGCHDVKPGPKRTLVLARCRVRDLGFIKAPTTPELLARVDHVADRCPQETAPYLRLALPEQPIREHITIVTTPILDPHGNPSMFSVGCNVKYYNDEIGTRYIGMDTADEYTRWDLDCEVVVVLRDKYK